MDPRMDPMDRSTTTTYDPRLIADLNDLIQLDLDAVAAYTVALNAVRSEGYRDTLVEFRADHVRHIDELGALIRERGGVAVELPHPTGPFKVAVQALGAVAFDDAAVLLAFKANEGQVRDKYRSFASRSYPAEVLNVIRRAAEDEAKHYRWASDTLRKMGYGENSAAGATWLAMEMLNKFIATPIEAIARTAMRAADEAWMRPRHRASGMHGERSSASSTHGWARTPVVESFQHALRAVEERNDVEWMASLYAADAVLTNSQLPAAEERGPEGARRFWSAYRARFATVRSEFGQVVEGPGVATLQWTTRGTTPAGASVMYSGVSVVQHAGGLITRFQAFFDPADMLGDAPASARAGTAAGAADAASGMPPAGAGPTTVI